MIAKASRWIFVVLVAAVSACRGGGCGSAQRDSWPTEIGAAAKLVAQHCGQPESPLFGMNDNGDKVPTKGFSIDCDAKTAEALLGQAHRPLRDKGLYLFLYEAAFGIRGQPDKLGILPTRDPYEVMATMGTNAANYDKDTKDLIAWMRALEREQPFELTGIGFDFLSGRFTSRVKDPAKMAKRMYEFCPDIVEQGVGSIDALADELRSKGTLYFWWD